MAGQDIHAQRIMVLDFGSEYTQLIARKVRSAGVYCEIHPFDVDGASIKAFNPCGVILSDDPTTEPLTTNVQPPACLFDLQVPVLSIGYDVSQLAQKIKIQAAYDKTTPALVEQFVLQDCGCEALWTPANIVADAIAKVRAQVGERKVLLGLSGGVDSSVVAALLHRAIGDQLTCVFVDHGLLRLHEGDQVMQMFAENMGVKVIRVDAEQRYLDLLKGVSDPEEKRKIIGRTFIELFDEEAAKLEGIDFLAQGTIYPDVIESVAMKHGKAHTIKSHHNVGGLPEDMKFELVEPLRELFKDEVRRLGVELGLPHDMVYRHPFPGPGLGVRILGEIKKEYADLLRQADHIFIEELRAAGWYEKTSQAFAVFIPVKSVGMVNDQRRYAWVVSLRAVETIDFMTARWAHLPYELLEKVSSRIIKEIEGVSRVVYDVSSKPPATIEWE
ncbi:glutamine-hydrolyzing GMP synthase [Thiopseudomonas acetoxidans]|uniref:GMP synthase [glutamine-hydrolyzing] n=1 Tax=Thiopseudomonas acetoxidans TaxID=3041622 RepID=A0ABT7SS48_9GAMM|nr:glutamine-hydrolyzing GMP synthase [Thiopseudomonas sp. CY1220]MDM7858407.1 glutamine-hydrolyzing GMP synthase [Thiopseudomonas sp. CY1220]